LRLHRVHVGQPLKPESDILLAGGIAHYLRRVIRLEAGQSIVLFNGDGSDYLAEIIKPGKHEVLAQVLRRVEARPESPLRVTLVQALSRGERMDQTLQKGTELGVAAFRPVISERVEIRIRPDKLAKRMEHWRKVVISACEQCGRAVIPAVSEPVNLDQFLAEASSTPRMMLEPGSKTALAQLRLEHQVELLVGPEGGFSSGEIVLAREHGVLPISLGPRILRTETAGAAACAVLQALAGDFR